MREIKFRAWDGKAMSSSFTLSSQHTTFDDCKSYCRIYNENHSWEIMQYIGIKDKNGKEIYEGDIVTAKTCKGNGIEDLFGEVVFGDAEYLVEQDNGYFPLCSFRVIDLSSFEVIGNIYENEDLLK